jgi:hypothetical protein
MDWQRRSQATALWPSAAVRQKPGSRKAGAVHDLGAAMADVDIIQFTGRGNHTNAQSLLLEMIPRVKQLTFGYLRSKLLR